MNQIGLDKLPEATGTNSDLGPNLPYSCSFILTGSISNVLRIWGYWANRYLLSFSKQEWCSLFQVGKTDVIAPSNKINTYHLNTWDLTFLFKTESIGHKNPQTNHKIQTPELHSYNKNCSDLLPFFFFMHSDDKLGISSFEFSSAIHYTAFTLSTLTLSLSSFVPNSNCSSYNAIIVIKNNLNHWQHCLVCSRIPCALVFF